MPVRTFAVVSVFSSDVMAICQSYEAVDAMLCDEDDTSTVATVTTIGPSARNVFFAAKTHASMSAASANYFDLNLVNEHGIPDIVGFGGAMDEPGLGDYKNKGCHHLASFFLFH